MRRVLESWQRILAPPVCSWLISGIISMGTSALPAAQAPAGVKPLPHAPGRGTNVYLIDLPTALRLAGARNLDVKIARQKLAEARARQQSATWRFLPVLRPGVGWRAHQGLIQATEGRLTHVEKQAYRVGPVLDWQLDLGSALYDRLVTQQEAEAARQTAEAQWRWSVLTAAQQYLDLARAHAAVAVAQDALRLSSNYLAQVRHAVAAGTAFRGEALRVQAQVEQDRIRWRRALEQERLTAARLVQTLHLKAGLRLEPDPRDPPWLTLVDTNLSLDHLLARAQLKRPELAALRHHLAATRHALKAATYGPLIPSLGAQVFGGGLGGSSQDFSSRFSGSADYQVGLAWRIGPGGLFDQGRIRAARARTSIAALEEQQLQDEIARQVVEARVRTQSLTDQLQRTAQGVQAAERALQLALGRRRFGVGMVLEVIDAQRALLRARLEHLRVKTEYTQVQYFLAWTTGGLDEAPGPAWSGAPLSSPETPR